MKKNVIVILLVLLSITLPFVAYQLLQPILTEQEAIGVAKEIINIVNTQMKLNYDTNLVEASWLNQDDPWNRLVGIVTWTVFIDSVAIELDASSGEFIRMVFPSDGVLTKDDAKWLYNSRGG